MAKVEGYLVGLRGFFAFSLSFLIQFFLVFSFLLSVPLFSYGESPQKNSTIPSDISAWIVERDGLQKDMPVLQQKLQRDKLPGLQQKSQKDSILKYPNNQGIRKSSVLFDMFVFLAKAIVIFTVIVIVFFLAKNFLERGSQKNFPKQKEDAEFVTASLARMGQAQEKAEEYARSGSLREAMHVLLLQSLQELRLRLETNFSRSLTSREILRKVRLSDSGYNALSHIIEDAEAAYFGYKEVSLEEYEACRSSYYVLVQALSERMRV